jgi:hypothetical protein
MSETIIEMDMEHLTAKNMPLIALRAALKQIQEYSSNDILQIGSLLYSIEQIEELLATNEIWY